MAEKGFGVKEINLIGPSGTPTITSPNNLNLNANNVAISTNVSIGGTLSVTGNVSVGGTLTYEDVTNIDSVGLITARNGLIVTAGVSTFAGITTVTGNTLFAKQVNVSGVSTFQNASSYQFTVGAGNLIVNGNSIYGSSKIIILGGGGSDTQYYAGGTSYSDHIFKTLQGGAQIERFRIGATGDIGLSGENYGTSGQVLTSGGSGNAVSWSNITPTNSDIQVVYEVTANGSSAYRFAGNGVVSTADNPDLYLIRGQKYRFINNSGGSHPFQIRESSGGSAYSTGVTNNGAASGNIDFAPTYDSPAQLVYQCTSHGGMVGNIYLRGGNGNETNVGVTTFTTPTGRTQGSYTQASSLGSGTYTFTGIPSTAYKVVLNVYEISSTSQSYMYMRVGSSGGIVSSGYKNLAGYHYYNVTDSTRSNSDSRFSLFAHNWDNASYKWTGQQTLTKIYKSGSQEQWMCNTDIIETTTTNWQNLLWEQRGIVNLGSNTLDRIVLYASAGNFDGGYISVDYFT